MIDIEHAHPIGSTVATVVYGIGGRSETVVGTVTGYFRDKCVNAKTEFHGTLCIERAKVIRCGCPDDCGCRQPHRANVCGCQLH